MKLEPNNARKTFLNPSNNNIESSNNNFKESVDFEAM